MKSRRTTVGRIAAFVIFVIAIPSLSAAAAFSQQLGDLTIRVVDQTGGALPHATIVLQRDGANVPAAPSVMTDEAGVYSAKGLAAGKYSMTVTIEGFVPNTKNVDVKANRVNEVRVILLVSHAEVVKVPGLPIKLTNSLTGMTITGDALDRLPSGEIDLLATLRQMAGTRGRPGDVAIYVDGFRDFRRLPPKEAIDLIQINGDPYSTEFAEPGTRRIEILTKPGADGTFGQLKLDFNDDALNSKDPLATSKPQLQRRTFSAYFSAPIIPQKWGYYLYAGRWEEDENAIVRATTLDSAFEPIEFRQTLSAPLRTNNITFNTGFALGAGHRLKLEYSRDGTKTGNQGLERGFDLPERAYSTESTVQAGRFSLLSVWGSSAVFEFRVQAKRDLSKARAVSDQTAIVVLDAFSSGGNQSLLHKDVTTDSVQVDSKLTKGFGNHTVKVGFQSDGLRLRQFDQANFGGTFTFGADIDRDATGAPLIGPNGQGIPISPLERYRRTVLGLPGYRPSLFRITTGNPEASVRQWNAGAYLQDDWIASSNFTVSAGMRVEAQSNISEKVDLAPRLGVTWALGTNGGVIRSGSGVFYTRFDPSLTMDTLRLDGQRQQEFVVAGPAFFPSADLSQGLMAPSIWTKADGLRANRTWVSNFGYERTVFGPIFGSVSYTYERGDRLTRMTDINAPLALGAARPNPAVGEILQYLSDGESTRREIQAGLRADFKNSSHILVNYTYAKTNSNTDGPRTLPADVRNLAAEWAPVATDERHRVYVSGTLMLPGMWMFIPSVVYTSPRPFNITTGLDNNLDGHFTDRPSFASAGDPLAISTPYGLLNPFPKAGETIIPRNFGRGHRLLVTDLSLAKIFILQDPTQGKRVLSLHVSAKNLFNARNLRDINGVLLSPNFLEANTAFTARQISFGLGFTF